MSNKYPAIPEPRPDVPAIYDTLVAVKQTVEMLAGVRGVRRDDPVTWGELVTLGIIAEDQIPKR